MRVEAIVCSPMTVGSPDDPPQASELINGELTGLRRIMVVEDEVFVRMDIERMLDKAGYEVVAAVESAEEALAAAELERPDLVVMDIRIVGEADGIEAALELARRFNIRCLFVSANIDEGARRRAAKAKPWGFLSKPFSEEELLSAVHKQAANLL